MRASDTDLPVQNQLLKRENQQIKAMATNSKLLCVCDKKPKLQEFLRNSDQKNQMTLELSWNFSKIPLLPAPPPTSF